MSSQDIIKSLDETLEDRIRRREIVIFEHVRKAMLGGAAYFNDGERRVHYVLVLSMDSVYKYTDVVENYINNLVELGMEFEQESGITMPLMFIKIHINDEITEYFADALEVKPEFLEDFDYCDPNPNRFKAFKTPLRSRNVFKNVRHAQLSSTKIKIIEYLLHSAYYGKRYGMQSIEKLKKLGVIQDYYALHDGTIQTDYWNNDDIVNERTLLAKYWGNYHMVFKEQPLDLIHKYFGAEVAFYFAWLDFFNRMLLPIAIIGVILVVIRIIEVVEYGSSELDFMCKSEELVCGLCIENYGCEQKPLKKYCNKSKVVHILEGTQFWLYSVSVSIWGMLFTSLWKRKEIKLKYRWNLLEKQQEEEKTIRLAYKSKLEERHLKYNKIIQEIPSREKYSRYIIGFLLCTVVLVFITCFCLAKQIFVAYSEVEIAKLGLKSLLAHVYIKMSSFIQAGFTVLISIYLKRICLKIVNIIFPKTREIYEKLIIYLIFALDLFNNYAPLFNVAFLKNINFNVPYDSGFELLKYSGCGNVPCLYPLFDMLWTFLTVKILAGNISLMMWPKVQQYWRKCNREQLDREDMPLYEEEYHFKRITDNYFNMDISKKCIQYGMMIGFVYAFPLAPLCLLFQNILSLRWEANGLVHLSRRPCIIKKYDGIGDWINILDTLTMCASIINFYVITYVGSHYDWLLHKRGYFKRVYSEFEPYSVFGIHNSSLPNKCIYRGHFFGPYHINRYKRNKRNFILQFFHTVMMAGSLHILILVYFVIQKLISTIPINIKKKNFLDRTNLNNWYNEMFNAVEDLDFKEEDD